MDFYCDVTKENAKEWYDELPTHLRKVVDATLEQYTKADPREQQKLDDRIAELTSEEIGYELPTFVVVNRGPEGNMPDEIERFDRRNIWCKLYNAVMFTTVVVREAPKLQKERKALSQALGLKQGGNGLPSQAEGLEDTQAATIRWLQMTGDTPLEYLTNIYRDDNPDISVGNKIAAARALLDYVHRKIPQKQEIETKAAPKVDPSWLKNLSSKELDLLESLMKKMEQS